MAKAQRYSRQLTTAQRRLGYTVFNTRDVSRRQNGACILAFVLRVLQCNLHFFTFYNSQYGPIDRGFAFAAFNAFSGTPI